MLPVQASDDGASRSKRMSKMLKMAVAISFVTWFLYIVTTYAPIDEDTLDNETGKVAASLSKCKSSSSLVCLTRKPKKLALVLPFQMSQIDERIASIRRWSALNLTPMCSQIYSKHVTAILWSNTLPVEHSSHHSRLNHNKEHVNNVVEDSSSSESKSESESDRLRLTELVGELERALRGCVGDVQLRTAALGDDEEAMSYPANAGLQFAALLLSPGERAKALSRAAAVDKDYKAVDARWRERQQLAVDEFDYFLWVEADVQPVRPLWLDGVYESVVESQDFFVKGSAFHGRHLDSAATSAADPRNKWLPHINGNALFSTAPAFRDLLRSTLTHQRVAQGFDVAIWLEFHSWRRTVANWQRWQQYASHFVHSDFVYNHGASLTTSIVEHIHSTMPRTFLVHGSSPSRAR
jgi:hypothetical protein